MALYTKWNVWEVARVLVSGQNPEQDESLAVLKTDTGKLGEVVPVSVEMPLTMNLKLCFRR